MNSGLIHTEGSFKRPFLLNSHLNALTSSHFRLDEGMGAPKEPLTGIVAATQTGIWQNEPKARGIKVDASTATHVDFGTSTSFINASTVGHFIVMFRWEDDVGGDQIIWSKGTDETVAGTSFYFRIISPSGNADIQAGIRAAGVGGLSLATTTQPLVRGKIHCARVRFDATRQTPLNHAELYLDEVLVASYDDGVDYGVNIENTTDFNMLFGTDSSIANGKSVTVFEAMISSKWDW